jgi:AAA+ superfamily predicted ATPase
LDSAARDRFDFHIAVPLPNEMARLKLLVRAVQAINSSSSAIGDLGPPLKTRSAQKLLRATDNYSVRRLNHLILRTILLHNGDISLDTEQLLRTALLMLANPSTEP